MRIVILTSNRVGTASYCLPDLVNSTNSEIVRVIYSRGIVKKDGAYYRKRLKKVWKIGILGAINGVRIRSWFKGSDKKENLRDIEAICKELGVDYAETPAINHATTVELIKTANADLGLSLGNSYIPKKVFSVPKFGMLNIHGEVLPDFQNAQSVIWQIYENSPVTGYTIHKIDNKIDTGEIVKQEKFPILFQSTLAETVRKTMDQILDKSCCGLIEVINNFEDYFNKARTQGKGKSYTTPSYRQFRRIKRNFEILKNQYSI